MQQLVQKSANPLSIQHAHVLGNLLEHRTYCREVTTQLLRVTNLGEHHLIQTSQFSSNHCEQQFQPNPL